VNSGLASPEQAAMFPRESSTRTIEPSVDSRNTTLYYLRVRATRFDNSNDLSDETNEQLGAK
jgi:hypothetical protein